MKRSNGFSLVEVLITTSIIFMVVTTFIPITSLINNEKDVLSHRRIYTAKLHDELQKFLWDDDLTLPAFNNKTINGTTVHFHFIYERDLIRGCAEWENIKKVAEKNCLYGYRKK